MYGRGREPDAPPHISRKWRSSGEKQLSKHPRVNITTAVPSHRTARPKAEPHTDKTTRKIYKDPQGKTSVETPEDYEDSPGHRSDEMGEYGDAPKQVFGWIDADNYLEHKGAGNVTRKYIYRKKKGRRRRT